MIANAQRPKTTLNGEALATGLPAPSPFAPLVDKVGVPLMWFGIGYLVATLVQKPKRGAP